MPKNDDIAIKVSHLSKTFKLPHEKQNSIKGLFVSMFSGKRTYEKQKVLKDVTFEVKRGEFFGIIGRNGSGKSTLLKMLAGVYAQDGGNIEVNGKLTPFIELGVGFNPELTGRENVFLNGALLGFNRNEMEAMYDEIVKFAELENFMDQKLKNYSSGMQVRLAFSIAIRVNTEILVLDEVLAVGDASFQRKCLDYFKELKKQKKTVVLISHDMNSITEYCDRAILIDKGEITHRGNADKVAQAYRKLFMIVNGEATSTNASRWGDGSATIDSVKMEMTEKSLVVNMRCKFHKEITEPIVGLLIKSPTGLKLVESNTKWLGVKTGSYRAGDTMRMDWTVPNIFANGMHTVTAALSSSDGLSFYDWRDEAAGFIVDKNKVTTAVTLPELRVNIKR